MKLHRQFQQVRTPQPWLYRTVHNLVIDHHRRAKKIVPFEAGEEDSVNASDLFDSHPSPDEHIARCEGIGLVRRVLETLDARSQEVVRLRFHEDLSYKEISSRTGLTVGHVGYLLHHALKALAAELEKTGVTS